MKKSVVFLFIAILASILSGCILSKTPTTNDVAMPLGDQMTFSVNVFPSSATYIWTLDETTLPDTGKSYIYTAEAGDHILVVKAKQGLGTDTQTWNIQTEDPVTQLLNSLVAIPAGSFIMGSTQSQYEQPVHQVTLQAFDIGAYEVTQAQYQAVMGVNPSCFQAANGYTGSMNRPVETVSWYDARAFCTALSALTGRTFTLPSEAQWEYACRAGTTTLYSYGDSDALLGNYAWWWANSDSTGGPYGTHPVGTKLPNPWGLYDMHGNAAEWTLSAYAPYPYCDEDGRNKADSDGRKVVRGGSFFDNPRRCRSSFRLAYPAWQRVFNVGFRIVCEEDPNEKGSEPSKQAAR